MRFLPTVRVHPNQTNSLRLFNKLPIDKSLSRTEISLAKTIFRNPEVHNKRLSRESIIKNYFYSGLRCAKRFSAFKTILTQLSASTY